MFKFIKVDGWWSHWSMRWVSSVVAAARALLTIAMQVVLLLHQEAFWLELIHDMTILVSPLSRALVPSWAISVQILLDPHICPATSTAWIALPPSTTRTCPAFLAAASALAASFLMSSQMFKFIKPRDSAVCAGCNQWLTADLSALVAPLIASLTASMQTLLEAHHCPYFPSFNHCLTTRTSMCLLT